MRQAPQPLFRDGPVGDVENGSVCRDEPPLVIGRHFDLLEYPAHVIESRTDDTVLDRKWGRVAIPAIERFGDERKIFGMNDLSKQPAIWPHADRNTEDAAQFLGAHDVVVDYVVVPTSAMRGALRTRKVRLTAQQRASVGFVGGRIERDARDAGNESVGMT